MNSRPSYFAFAILLFSNISCSLFSFRRDGDEQAKAASLKAQTVSKKDYDELKKRYDSLLAATQGADEQSMQKSNELMNDLSSSGSGGSAASFETVDVFGDYPSKEKSQSQTTDGVEKQIMQLKRISSLLVKKDFDNAMTLLKPLESSSIKQIRTQAKFLLAESLFMQKEYDLAMQVYEELIKQDAYSSLVIKTLGRLIACCEKLELREKKDKYYSLLHDFFEG